MQVVIGLLGTHDKVGRGGQGMLCRTYSHPMPCSSTGKASATSDTLVREALGRAEILACYVDEYADGTISSAATGALIIRMQHQPHVGILGNGGPGRFEEAVHEDD
jgi:hypothetical protein